MRTRKPGSGSLFAIPCFLFPITWHLFIPQGHHGIDLRRSAGGQVAGQQRHRNQDQRHACERDRIACLEAKKHAGEKTRHGHTSGDARDDPDHRYPKPLPRDAAQYVGPFRSQRHPNANFPRASSHLKRKQAVEPNAGEQQRQAAKKLPRRAIRRSWVNNSSIRCDCVRTPKMGRFLSASLTVLRTAGISVAGTRRRAQLESRAAARYGDVNSGMDFAPQAVVLRVSRHADDLPDLGDLWLFGRVAACFGAVALSQPLAQRILVLKIVANEAGIHKHGDRRTRGG